MTTYTSISNASVAVGGIPSSATVTALRDNPSAIAESAAGAPVMAAGWHPYDKVTNGDTSTGLLFDFATAGAQASVQTPNFDDGYEYRFVGIDLSGSGTNVPRLEVYGETAGAYDTGRAIVNFANGRGYANATTLSFDAELLTPRASARFHFARVSGMSYDGTNFDTFTDTLNAVNYHFYATAQKILKVRFLYGTGATNIDAGKLYLFRRREFVSKT